MAWTNDIANEVGVSRTVVEKVAGEIGVNRYGSYEILDENVPKLKWEIFDRQRKEIQKYIDEFGIDFPETVKLAKEYKMENLLNQQKDNSKEIIEQLQTENNSLKRDLSEQEELILEAQKNGDCQSKLDLIEKEKQEIAQIVQEIQKRFFNAT